MSPVLPLASGAAPPGILQRKRGTYLFTAAPYFAPHPHNTAEVGQRSEVAMAPMTLDGITGSKPRWTVRTICSSSSTLTPENPLHNDASRAAITARVALD